MRADPLALCAERHANADLAAALRDRVAQHAICSNGREKQSDTCKNSGEQGRRAARDETVRDARIHGTEVVDRQLRIRRFLIGVVDAGKSLDLAPKRLLVQAVDISSRAFFDGRTA